MTDTFQALTINVLTISDTRTKESDRSGPVLIDCLQNDQHRLGAYEIVKDDRYQIRSVVSQWVANPQFHVILTTGGTGITDRDQTPEALRPLFDKELQGFGELFRNVSIEEIGTSTMLSRTVAGIANRTLIFALPGSTGACRTAWHKILHAQLDCRTRPCNLAELILSPLSQEYKIETKD